MRSRSRAKGSYAPAEDGARRSLPPLYAPNLLEGVLRSLAHRLLLRHDGDGVHLHQEIRMCKTRDEHPRDSRWVGCLGPSVLKRGKTRLQRLPLDHVDVPLDDVLWSRTASRKRRAQVS